MQEGTVKFYNEAKGYGFIIPANGLGDIFVHSSGLMNDVRQNDAVTFDVEKDQKGYSAINVRIAR